MKKPPGVKAFSIRLPKDIWMFLKKISAEREEAMNVVIINTLIKMKTKREKRLKLRDTVVSSVPESK